MARGVSAATDPARPGLFVTFEGAFLLCRSLGDPSQMRTQLRTYRLLLAAVLGVTAE